MTTYYTYMWLRDDGTPYYVGKGKGSRAFDRHRIGNPPSKEHIVLQEFPDEASAFAAEIFLIAYYGRIDAGTGCLRNMADGGQGLSGPKPWVSARMKGNQHGKGKNLGLRPPQTGLKISLKMQGNKNGCGPRKPRSAEHARKLGNALRGRRSSVQARQRISEGLKRAYLTGLRSRKITVE